MMLTNVRDTRGVALLVMLFFRIMVNRLWNDVRALASCCPKSL